MRLVAVIDLMNRKVVRGIGGVRESYQPIVSRLTRSKDPLDIAKAFRENFNLSELYLADLDAIAGEPPSIALYRELCDRGFTLWVDAGLRDVNSVERLLEAGVQFPVAGLETLTGRNMLSQLCARCGTRLVFSLDLKHGQPITASPEWPEQPLAIAECAVALGVTRLLVLDLARVGKNKGTGTEELCRELTTKYPTLEVSAGGGLRGPEDFRRLSEVGVSAALVASALHETPPLQEDPSWFSDRHR